MTESVWATVTAVSPLRIRLDGAGETALPFTPESLIDPLELLVGDRVRCEITDKRVLIHGYNGGVSRLLTDARSRLSTAETKLATAEAKLATLTSFSLRVPLPLSSRARARNSSIYGNERDPYTPFWVTKSAGGAVSLEGLGTGFNALAAGAVLAVLPAGYRPATTERYPAEYNGVARAAVTVATNGQITASVALASTDYLSLANVVFLEASVAAGLTWNTPALNAAAGWSAVSGFTPQWAVDSYGVVWMRGRAAKAGAWTDNQRIFNIAAPFQPSRYHHFAASSASLYCYAAIEGSTTGGGGVAAGDVMSKASGALAGGDISFAGIFYAPASLDASFSLIGATNYAEPLGDIGFANNWQNFGAAPWTSAAIWKRADAFCMARGLLSTGTMGANAFIMPPGMRPPHRIFIERPSNAAHGLVQINPTRYQDTSIAGALAPTNASSAWFSLDGVGYNAGS